MLNQNIKFVHNYKGILYRYEPINNIWILSDRQDEMGAVMAYSASMYRTLEGMYNQYVRENESYLKRIKAI